MKSIMLVAVVAGLLSGCANMSQPGGSFGMLQTADETLAAKYGVPVAVMGKIRTVLGIPDVRTLPDASRVLPEGWAWKYDLLDASNRVVDVTQFHYDKTPRLIPAGTNVANPIIPASVTSATGTETIERLLKLLQDNPGLLAPAK